MERLILELFLPYRLNRLGAEVSEQLKGIYRRKYGLTIPEWRVLATLGQFGELTATVIGQHAAMHKTKVSRAVSALEKRRWLARVSHHNDRRVEVLALTSAGLRTYNSIVPSMLGFETMLFDKIGRNGIAIVESALMLLERALEISTKPP
jgi:DNA-binding MarR family transcriptional regulator